MPLKSFSPLVQFLSLCVAPVVMAASPTTLIMRRQMIHDSFIDKDAYAVLVPDHWKAAGKFDWVPNRPAPEVYVVVNNPDNTAAYQELPRLLYQANVRENGDYLFPGQRSVNAQKLADGQTVGIQAVEIRHVPESTSDYVTRILIPSAFPGMAKASDLTIVSETDMPDLANALSEKDPGHRQAKAAKVRLTFTGPKGPTEAELICRFNYQPLKQNTRGGAAPPAAPIFWTASVSLFRAPKGQLDALLPTLQAIHSSLQVQLPWFNIMSQVAVDKLTALQQAEANAIYMQGQNILNNLEIAHKAAMEKSDVVSKEIHDKFADQMAAKQDGQTREMHYINDTGNYRDSNTGQLLTLSDKYKYHYVSNNGDVLETEDPAYKPPVDPKTSWQLMDRVN